MTADDRPEQGAHDGDGQRWHDDVNHLVAEVSERRLAGLRVLLLAGERLDIKQHRHAGCERHLDGSCVVVGVVVRQEDVADHLERAHENVGQRAQDLHKDEVVSPRDRVDECATAHQVVLEEQVQPAPHERYFLALLVGHGLLEHALLTGKVQERCRPEHRSCQPRRQHEAEANVRPRNPWLHLELARRAHPTFVTQAVSDVLVVLLNRIDGREGLVLDRHGVLCAVAAIVLRVGMRHNIFEGPA